MAESAKSLKLPNSAATGGMLSLLGHGTPKMKLAAFVGWLSMVVALIVNSQEMIAP
ncbi:hypothetical protein C2S52_004597 [Perilla frutescens var. hirtella]|nr:hypothetical protein C2S52_004597 [Perilla frutescens var. hirtella]